MRRITVCLTFVMVLRHVIASLNFDMFWREMAAYRRHTHVDIITVASNAFCAL